LLYFNDASTDAVDRTAATTDGRANARNGTADDGRPGGGGNDDGDDDGADILARE
jgi:hypothetical protein